MAYFLKNQTARGKRPVFLRGSNGNKGAIVGTASNTNETPVYATNYFYPGSPAEYPPHGVLLLPDQITRDGNPVNSTNNTVWVGQQINLTNAVSGVPTNAISYHWGIPGAAFKGYQPDIFSPYSCNYTSNSPSDYTSNFVNFYWANGATNRVVYCTNVIYGQTNVVSATFNVNRPQAGIITTNAGLVCVGNGTTIFDAGTNTYLSDGGQTNVTPHTPGIIFGETNSLSSGNAGQFGWVQIITSDVLQVTVNGSSVTEPPLYGLDTTFPYDTGTNTSDSPRTPLLPLDPGETNEADCRTFSATMYLMWQPTTNMIGNDNAVWVPLRGVNWNWSGTATNSGAGWGLQTSTNSSASLTNDFDVLSDGRVTNEVQWTTNAHPSP